MLGYGQIEKAFAALYGLDEAARLGSLRSRFKRLGTLGVPLKTGPGRGGRRDYGPDEQAQLLIAYELAEADVDPTAIASLIRASWQESRKRDDTDTREMAVEKLAELVRLARKTENAEQDVVVTIRLDAASKKIPEIGYFRFTAMSGWFHWLRDESEQRRSLCFNLSARLRAFEKALEVAAREQDSEEEPAAQAG